MYLLVQVLRGFVIFFSLMSNCTVHIRVQHVQITGAQIRRYNPILMIRILQIAVSCKFLWRWLVSNRTFVQLAMEVVIIVNRSITDRSKPRLAMDLSLLLVRVRLF